MNVSNIIYVVLRLKCFKNCLDLILKIDLVKELFPVVLRHEPEEGQKGPAEGVKTGVAVVGIPPHFEAVKPIWALPVEDTRKMTVRQTPVNKGFAQLNERQLGEKRLWGRLRAGCNSRVKTSLAAPRSPLACV